MADMTPATYPVTGRERFAGWIAASIQARHEHSEARSLPSYDEVDARLMDTFPASDAVARY